MMSSLLRRGTKRSDTAKLHLSRDLSLAYSEIIPILSGSGKCTCITLLGRRRDDPQVLDKVLSQAWKPGEAVQIVWEASQVGVTE